MENKLHIENRRRYESGTEVDSYLQEPYHMTRILKAMDILDDLLASKFPLHSKSQLEILELAGSSGFVSNCLCSRGYSVVLNDIEKRALRQAIDRYPEMKTLCFDAEEKFPIEDESFNAIFAGELIEHLFDTKMFLSECYRCLKPNGILVLTTPNLATVQDRVGFLFGKSPRQVNPFHEYLYLHIRPFTVSKLKEVCAKMGFREFIVKTNTIVLRFGKKRIYFPKLGNLLPSIGGSIILGAVKLG